MNQNNNIIGYDSQTGQPIYANQNINIEQPVQTQMNIDYNKQSQHPKKNNKIPIIIAIVIVVGIAAVVLYFNNQDKKEPTNNIIHNDSEVENNSSNKYDNNKENNNSIGTVDKNTNTTYDENGAFLMAIEDVFTITGRGTIVTGTISRGKIKEGDTVQIVGFDNDIKETVVDGIEMFREIKDEATVGDNVGIFLRDITREDVQRGQVIAKPNSILASNKFDAEVYMLTKEEDGRHTPFFDGYKPQFYFRIIDIKGTIDLPDDIEMVMPGDTVSLTVTLESKVAMEIGTEFSIREGGKTIGKGTITKVY